MSLNAEIVRRFGGEESFYRAEEVEEHLKDAGLTHVVDRAVEKACREVLEKGKTNYFRVLKEELAEEIGRKLEACGFTVKVRKEHLRGIPKEVEGKITIRSEDDSQKLLGLKDFIEPLEEISEDLKVVLRVRLESESTSVEHVFGEGLYPHPEEIEYLLNDIEELTFQDLLLEWNGEIPSDPEQSAGPEL